MEYALIYKRISSRHFNFHHNTKQYQLQIYSLLKRISIMWEHLIKNSATSLSVEKVVPFQKAVYSLRNNIYDV
jgi:hypothetical protein